MIRRRWLAFALITAIGAGGIGALSNAAKPAEGEQFAGNWAGSWEGGGTGKFDIKLERGGDGAVTGGVSVGTDQGDYTATFKTLTFEGGKMSARYDFPLDAQGEIILAGTFEAAKASGTWSLVQKGGDQAFAQGTWMVEKK